jgi:hypothetical protein
MNSTVKSRKVLDVRLDNGRNYICIQNPFKTFNQYTLYHRWYDQGWHRVKVVSYEYMGSVLAHLLDLNRVY